MVEEGDILTHLIKCNPFYDTQHTKSYMRTLNLDTINVFKRTTMFCFTIYIDY